MLNRVNRRINAINPATLLTIMHENLTNSTYRINYAQTLTTFDTPFHFLIITFDNDISYYFFLLSTLSPFSCYFTVMSNFKRPSLPQSLKAT